MLAKWLVNLARRHCALQHHNITNHRLRSLWSQWLIFTKKIWARWAFQEKLQECDLIKTFCSLVQQSKEPHLNTTILVNLRRITQWPFSEKTLRNHACSRKKQKNSSWTTWWSRSWKSLRCLCPKRAKIPKQLNSTARATASRTNLFQRLIGGTRSWITRWDRPATTKATLLTHFKNEKTSRLTCARDGFRQCVIFLTWRLQQAHLRSTTLHCPRAWLVKLISANTNIRLTT